MTITKEQVAQWAYECGTPYVNRHFPDRTSYGFNEETLLKFAQLAYEAGKSTVSEPVNMDDLPHQDWCRYWNHGDFCTCGADTPPTKAKPLTDEKIKQLAAPLFMSHYWKLCNEFARAIEAAHGIVNIGAKEQ